MIDDLNRKLLYHLSTGINSYEELARLCNVSRNTVYKRIAELEKQKIIKNIIRCSVNFERLNIAPLIIAATVPTVEEDRAFNTLAENPKIRFLWRTFGDHNLSLLAFCSKGEEGKVIDNITRTLERSGCMNVEVSTGYSWEKSETAPFDVEPVESLDSKEVRVPKMVRL